MPNRIIKDSICTSDDIDGLSDKAQILFYRLIVQCDDYGCFDGRLSIIRSKCFPLRIDTIKDKDVEKWLSELAAAKMIRFYTSGGNRYLLMTSWSSHQQMRARRRKYPEPDINGNQAISDDINGLQLIPAGAESESESESESYTNPNPCIGTSFDDFWVEYPKKVAKVDAVKAFAKIKPDDQLMAKIMEGLCRWKKARGWTKDGGQWVPYAATWLNGKRWEDEVPAADLSAAERIMKL